MSEPNVEPSSGGGNPLSVLTRKVGPLPGWAWVAIAVGGYLAYRYIRGRNAPAAIGADNVAATGDGTPSDSAAASGTDGGLGAGDVSTGFQQAPTTATPSGPRDNGTWASMAVAYLVTKGHNPIGASNAISNYVGRKPLTDAQRKMVNDAIRAIGSPPEGIIGGTVAPSGKTSHNIAYTTKRGDTLYHLAVRYYGNQSLWTHIRSHNDNLKSYNPSEKIHAGLHIVIPAYVTQPKAG